MITKQRGLAYAIAMSAILASSALAQTAPKGEAMAQPAPKMAEQPSPKISDATDRQMSARFTGSARTAERRIAANSGVREKLAAAVKAGNEEGVKEILMQNGFTTEQLRNATIKMTDHTGGGGPANKIKVKVSYSCCPSTITIEVIF